MSWFFPAWCRSFLTGWISPRCQRGLPPLNCRALSRPSFPITSVKLLMPSVSFDLPLPPPHPPLSPMLFLSAGFGRFWACLHLSVCLGNQTFHLVRFRSGTRERLGFWSYPSWLAWFFMCVYNFPIGTIFPILHVFPENCRTAAGIYSFCLIL